MIVFIFVIITVILIITTLCFIKIKVTKLKIDDYEDLKNIFTLIKQKDYANIFNYTDFVIKAQLCLFNKIPIISLEITNLKMKKIIKKQLEKDLTKEEREKQKKEAKIILPEIKLEKLNLDIDLGTENASITAIVATGMNIAISLILPFLVDRPNEKDYKYEVKPIYLSKQVFKMETSLVVSLSIINLIKSFVTAN